MLRKAKTRLGTHTGSHTLPFSFRFQESIRWSVNYCALSYFSSTVMTIQIRGLPRHASQPQGSDLVSICYTLKRTRRPGKARQGHARPRHARETDRARRPRIHQCRLLCALEAAEEIASHIDVVGPLAFT